MLKILGRATTSNVQRSCGSVIQNREYEHDNDIGRGLWPQCFA